MTFKQWIYSDRSVNPSINGAWGLPHIVTLVTCILLIVGIAFAFRNKEERARRIVVVTFAVLILILELARRIINFSGAENLDWHTVLYILLPRPWCAISCWFTIVSVFANKKFLYNYTAMTGLLCTLIFFAYPMAGFGHKYIQFENLYSIGTHFLLLASSVSLITLRFTDFRFKTKDGKFGAWKELICLAGTFLYGTMELFLDLSTDPLYFMPVSDARVVLGLSYPVYLVLYIVFLCVYFSAFYFVQYKAQNKEPKIAE